jgi:hypothetical protein
MSVDFEVLATKLRERGIECFVTMLRNSIGIWSPGKEVSYLHVADESGRYTVSSPEGAGQFDSLLVALLPLVTYQARNYVWRDRALAVHKICEELGL